MPSSLGAKKPMVERRKPIVTELALADTLDQLVNLIEELRVDVNLPVEITADDTQLLKISFSATPDVGFPLQRKVRDLPGQVCATSGTRASATTRPRTAPATRSETIGSGHAGTAHSKPTQQGVTPNAVGVLPAFVPENLRDAIRKQPVVPGTLPGGTGQLEQLADGLALCLTVAQ